MNASIATQYSSEAFFVKHVDQIPCFHPFPGFAKNLPFLYDTGTNNRRIEGPGSHSGGSGSLVRCRAGFI